jgi:hypothetical protein
MNTRSPIHNLQQKLEAARLEAIEELTKSGSPNDLPSADGLRQVALLHTALMAVREAIASHEPSVGSGGEQPLK